MSARGRRVRLRRAVGADLASIEAVERVCFAEARRSSRASMRHSLRSGAQGVWVAEAVGQGGAVEGVIGAMVLFYYRRRLRIYSVAVLPGFRELGAGRRLVRLAQALARRSGRAGVMLEADAGNRALVDWYARQGFVETGVLADFYGPGEDACRMVWEWRR